jgi:hypothetical protein
MEAGEAMDELIYNLRRLSEWTARELWENPVNFPEGVLKQAADELEKRRWVSVEERPPEEGEAVIWWIVPDKEGKRGFEIATTYEEWEGIPVAATHWMPSPEAPKEESNGNQR